MSIRVLIKIFLICFFSEMLIMLILNHLNIENMSSFQEALIDGGLLAFIITGALSVIDLKNKTKDSRSELQSEKIDSLKKALLIPVLLSLILLSVAGIQLRQLQSVKATLNNKLSFLIEKRTLINDIYDSFGYGGFIHNFKNYVLRGDEKYFVELENRRGTVLELLSDYESKENPGSEVLLHTNIIRSAVNKYYEGAEEVKQLRRRKIPVSLIDENVMIDDSKYIKSFNHIKEELEKQRIETLSDINTVFDNMITSFIISLLSSISFIFFISFFSNKKLMIARREAEKLSKIKSEFLANMSHEIRTPLNGVLGMLQMLKETILNKEQEGMVQTASSSGDSLLTILNDVLDLSKIDAEKMDLEIINFNVNTCIQDAIDLSKAKALEKNVVIKFNQCSKDEGSCKSNKCWFKGDITRIRQILVNFLSNAVKFSEEGEIIVSVEQIIINDETGSVTVSVKDNGIGISEEHQRDLFKDFSQGDNSTTRKFGGTGLGLSICRKLATAMNGEVFVESEKGQGSTFGLTIPLQYGYHEESLEEELGHDKAISNLEIAKLYPHRILLVEDNRVNQKLAQMMLRKLGYTCDVAANGIEALDALAIKSYSLIFMDMQMPEMDGVTATKKILEIYGEKRPSIVAMTANAFQEDKDKCFDAGMDDFTSKPIQLSELKKVVIKFGDTNKFRIAN